MFFFVHICFVNPQFSLSLCWSFPDAHHPSSLFHQFTLSLVVIEWFGWKMPQGCRCQPYAGAYSQRAGVGEVRPPASSDPRV